ncbi:MAG: AarF/UbiB family protein [Euryarchaeota archaeon]|nr:AarF/UbiB family protein [Euryarchaeota archaeon]
MFDAEFKRYAEIVDVLFYYGFGSLLLEDLSPGYEKLEIQKRLHPDVYDLPPYVRFRMAIEDLGATFVKFGQILSTRRETFPIELCHELEKLQDKVPPLPFEAVKDTIESVCGPIESAFATFDSEAFAAASISQVHRAVLHDGSAVAIKVKRPGIREQVAVDLPLLETLAELIEIIIPNVKPYNPRGIVSEFVTQIYQELNFVHEGTNADRLNTNFSSNPKVRAPKIYWEYSGSTVLTMEFVEGFRIDNVEAMQMYGINPTSLAVAGFQAYLQMVFIDGFFHSDPHPGNVMFTPDGTLIFIDFGMVGLLRQERRIHFIKLLLSIVDMDVENVCDAFRAFGMNIPTSEKFLDELNYVLQVNAATDVRAMDFGSLMDSLLELMQEYEIQVPSSLMQVLKVIWMVYDVAITLDPAFNFRKEVQPYLTKMMENEILTLQNVKNFPHLLFTIATTIADLPRNITSVMQNVSSGKFTFTIKSPELQALSTAISHATDRMVMGLLIGALVVGSSLALNSPYLSTNETFSWFAGAIYVIAVTFGIMLLLKAIME